jgi:hypothetical protein
LRAKFLVIVTFGDRLGRSAKAKIVHTKADRVGPLFESENLCRQLTSLLARKFSEILSIIAEREITGAVSHS